MTRKSPLALAAIIILAMATAGIWTALRLPPDARLAIHWHAGWRPDRWTGKWIAVLAMPGAALLAAIVMVAIERIEPRREGLAQSRGLLGAVWLVLIVLPAIAQLLILTAALGIRLPGDRIVMVATGAALALIGNQLGKSRPTQFMGVRTPWTLADPDIWIATHRLAGKLMVAVGLLACLVGLIGGPGPAMLRLLAALLLAAVLVPIVWSYLLWRRARAG